MKKYCDIIQPDTYYHIYNRACGFDKLFLEDRNYYYFMDLFKERLTDYVDLYCYCLLPNHFHMLVKTKRQRDGNSEEINYSKKFGNLFAAYTLSFNHYYHRKGNLFSQNFRRKLINNEQYLRTVVIYIHRNPLRHGLVKDLAEWKHSSYQEYIQETPRYCKNRSVLDWFSTREIYNFCHSLDLDSDIE